MNVRNLSFGVIGLGALIFLFAVVMWVGNRPDFTSSATAPCRLVYSPGSRQYDECYREAAEKINQANSAYNSCLFSSKYLICQGVTVLPYLSIAGIMILLAGGGLFVFNMTQRAARS